MQPSELQQSLEGNLQKYLRSTLPLERAHPELRPSVEDYFKRHPLLKDPFIEIVPPYTTGTTLQGLVEEGVIHAKTAEIFARYFMGPDCDLAKVELYKHQSDAIREVCGNGKNLVVCSGTGSGKTETFLIPMVDYLVRQWDAEGRPKRLSPGVRTMVLYPMNALVNDQIRRLRGVLQYAPFITFGRYIGDTEHTSNVQPRLVDFLAGDSEEREKLKNVDETGSLLGFDDEARLENEITTRDGWMQQPAHILVTNYSMLERLLLNPQGSPIFGEFWKYIILDEAHCYSGALGTEIAWLVRRVKRRLESVNPETRDRLRFLATSATLINDPGASDEVKADRIRNEFAARLFPAKPESFAVEFGSECPYEGEDSRTLSASDYIALVNDPLPDATHDEFQSLALCDHVANASLMQLTQDVKGWRDVAKALGKDLAAFKSDGMPLGDLLVVCSKVQNAVKAGMLSNSGEGIPAKLLSTDSLASIRALVELVSAGVADLASHDKWRELLHDPMDSAGASLGQSGKMGNRLHLLLEWKSLKAGEQTATLEGLEYLVRIAREVAIEAVDQGHSEVCPTDLLVISSADVTDWILWATESLGALNTRIERGLEILGNEWKARILASGYETELVGIELMLADFMAGDTRLQKAVSLLVEARHDWKDADRSRLEEIASGVFGDDAQRTQGLGALLDLATLAVPQGGRKPLVDVRYHQLMRGVTDVRLRFEGGVEALPQLVESQAEDVLPLGLCRRCGQGFALGYAKQQVLPENGEMDLRPASGGDFEYLHAFAWKQGVMPESQESYDQNTPEENGWLDPQSLRVAKGVGDCDGLLPLKWVVSPEDRNHKCFLKKCPNCGGKNQPTSGARFGVITPYEATGTQLRVTALEEFARLAAPSLSPESRKEPGNGRKVLAFSDSRRGAAQLAWRFEATHRRAIVERAIVESVMLLKDGELSDLSKKRIVSSFNIDSHLPDDLREKNIQWYLNEAIEKRGVFTLSVVLWEWLESHNAGQFLSICKVAENGKPEGELSEIEAAQVLILEALGTIGRNSLIARKRISVGSNLKVEPFSGFNEEVTQQCAEAILGALIGRVSFKLDNGWPREFIHSFGNEKPISLDGTEETMKFVSDQPTSLVNKLARVAIVKALPLVSWKGDFLGELNLPNALTGPALKWLVDLNDNELSDFVRAAVGAGPSDTSWVLYRSTAMVGLADSPANSLRVKANAFFAKLAGHWLGALWNQFTLNDNSVFVPSNDANLAGKLLNPNALCFSLPEASVELDGEEDPVDAFSRMVADREVIPLRIEEHTAQVASLRGAAYQRGFSSGKVNLLSCSTTFEMGVDLGDLGCVFLGNMPPAMANYRQRAGRAGRRPGAPAYVLTFVGQGGHDRYYWDRPGELLFGPMNAPRIYLEHSVFRARHLRAEALHHYMKWLGENRRYTVTGLNLKNDPPTPENVKRRPSTNADLFLGRRGIYSKSEPHLQWTREYDPLVEELSGWHQQAGDALQSYVSEIDDIASAGELDYSVAKDFGWQLTGKDEFAPFDLSDHTLLDRFRELGGCCLPEKNGEALKENENPRWKGLMHWIRDVALEGAEEWGQAPSWPQLRILNDDPLKWMTRSRVLPKYGFPVDVVALVPADGDPTNGNVKLERDLAMAIYEYAPGQVVIADKRRYPSEGPLVYRRGGLHSMLEDDQYRQWICSSCHEPARESGPSDPGVCALCRGDMKHKNFVSPDGFKARPSTPTAGSGSYENRGTPQQIYTGGIMSGSRRQVCQVQLSTGESASGRITFLNLGPAYEGFKFGNRSYSLRHEVYTDIALWLPAAGVFAPGSWLHSNGGQPISQPGGQRSVYRKDAIMRSALYALLASISREKQVNEQEVSGVVYPDTEGGGGVGFAFFDTASGGGGVVLDLVLGGDGNVDAGRAKQILRIVDRAIEICESCPQCNEVHGPEIPDESLVPTVFDEWKVLPEAERADRRQMQSCYHCVRNYSNQRFHSMLDRHDAARVLKDIRKAGQVGESVDPTPTEDPEEFDVPEGYLILSDLRTVPSDESLRFWHDGKSLPSLSQGGYSFQMVKGDEQPQIGEVVIFWHVGLPGGVGLVKWHPTFRDGGVVRIPRVTHADGNRKAVEMSQADLTSLCWAKKYSE